MIDVRRLEGTQFLEFTLGTVLGEGADGIVYAGRSPTGVVAIKFFFREILERNGFDAGTQRLDLQLQLAGRKQHPNLVEVLGGGFDEDLDTLYLIMERVPGASLDKILSDVPRDKIPALVTQLASAAEFLSQQGIIHRDIKPANIIISDDFSLLTLLDLGIAFAILDDDDPRLSGNKFVATTRYSPPEFVWRTEDSQSKDAWAAITYYQIGATVHDMIMKRVLFAGHDQPHAKLYDSVKLRSPEIDAADCPRWLISLAKCCLVKNWRERVRLVNWDLFRGEPATDDLVLHEREIRLKQLRRLERLAMESTEQSGQLIVNRVTQLWELQNNVFMEIREYLLSANIFPPRFSAVQERIGTIYAVWFDFEADAALGFDEPLKVKITFAVSQIVEEATTMVLHVSSPAKPVLFEAKWDEMLNIESATKIIQSSLMVVADSVIPE